MNGPIVSSSIEIRICTKGAESKTTSCATKQQHGYGHSYVSPGRVPDGETRFIKHLNANYALLFLSFFQPSYLKLLKHIIVISLLAHAYCGP